MAEFLIRVVDKTNPTDFYKNLKLSKRGYVIDVRDNGWPWQGELSEPYWRIVRHSGISVSEGSALLTQEIADGPNVQARHLQLRGFKLNLDASFPPAIRNFIDDNTRAVPILDITSLVTVTQFRALKIVVPKVVDPND